MTILIASDGDPETLRRQAAALVAHMRATAPPGALQLALLVGPRDANDALLPQAMHLPFSQVIVADLANRRAPASASDAAAALARLLKGSESPTPIGGGDLLCFAAGGAGEETAARLAAGLHACALGRVTDARFDGGALLVRKAVYGGRCQVTMRAQSGPWCISLRPGSDSALPGPAATPPQAPALTRVRVDLPASEDVVVTPGEPTRRPVETAPLVISGGRGAGPDGFALLDRLARALGGAVGASLPAVDAGWMPVTHQVGQSGKFVSPRQYLAVGISGTPQHMAGIGPDTSILAINNDPDAEIFRHADLGVVADWQTVLPALLAALSEAPECPSSKAVV